MTTDRSFVYDCYASCRSSLYTRTHGWMTRREVIAFCEEIIERRKEEVQPNRKSFSMLSEDEEEVDDKKPTCDIDAVINAHKANLDLSEWKRRKLTTRNQRVTSMQSSMHTRRIWTFPSRSG